MSRPAAAIVGTGFMGSVHAEALRRLGVPIAGVLGSRPDRSQKAAERYGAARAYASYDELLADPEVAVAHIVTPNRLHFEMTRRALAAGKHVMCEKPLAIDPAESAELVQSAAEHPHLMAGVNYNLRFYPMCIEARARVASGDVGAVYHVAGSYMQDWLLRASDYNWRVLADAGGPLRAVADIGTHWLDLIQWIVGRRIVSVCADLRTVHTVRYRPRGEVETFARREEGQATEPVEIATDDCGAVLLGFEDGLRGVMHVSQVTAGRKNCLRWELSGAEAALAWDSESPNRLWIGRRDGPNQDLIRDPALLYPAAAAATDAPGGHNEGFADTFKQGFAAFYQAIESGHAEDRRNVATLEDGHRELQLCDAILHSHRGRCWVEVGAAVP